jgi:hypothetical protein
MFGTQVLGQQKLLHYIVIVVLGSVMAQRQDALIMVAIQVAVVIQLQVLMKMQLRVQPLKAVKAQVFA